MKRVYWSISARPNAPLLSNFSSVSKRARNNSPFANLRTKSAICRSTQHSHYADPDDLAALLETIRDARSRADVVLVSLHWGIHMIRGTLADYQREVAHAAIAAGADAILGHHPHLMKGIDFHLGKPIFYSLGNFAIEQPHIFDPAITRSESFRRLVNLNPDWSLKSSYMLPEETRITGIVRLIIRNQTIAETRLRPCWIGDDSAPRSLIQRDPKFARITEYLREVSASEGLAVRIDEDGDELIIATADHG